MRAGTEWNLICLEYLLKHGVDRDDIILFSESNSRFIVEVQPEKQKEFEATISDIPYGCIGKVLDNDVFVHSYHKTERMVISEKISDLKEAWQATLRL